MPRHFNPWASYKPPTAFEKLTSLSLRLNGPPKNDERIPIRKTPIFPSGPPEPDEGPRVIWLGHASVYLLLPHLTSAGTREWRGILFDPVFSERCSPVSFLGPRRRITVPCRVGDLPRVDVVCISHDHYDHLDKASIKLIEQYHSDVKYYVPQGLKALLSKFGVSSGRVREMNWWEEDLLPLSHESKGSASSPGLKVERTVYMSASSPTKSQSSLSEKEYQSLALSPVPEVNNNGIDEVPFSPKSHIPPITPSTLCNTISTPSPTGNEGGRGGMKIVCCPAQHNSGRKLFGKNKTLWCTWWIEWELPGGEWWKCFFGGDTGYRSVKGVPTCPAFKLIRNRYGSPDLALLPIAHGSVLPYLQSLLPIIKFDAPRLTSSIHCSPSDAISLHQELGAKVSIPIHWATWSTESGTKEIIRALRFTCRDDAVGLKWYDEMKGGLPDSSHEGGVVVCDIGTTVSLGLRSGLICTAE
ncbi:hypothetical protein I302_100670 [Kwoniella bestiolae CBS 10118]|uniref:Metallo-beta-lactamase domain-containing protein n=1 Tax=Kwoniella bestiolae CBS 10118 TaxID=1296100 RepID=A0AAJ8K0I5_9TREE